MAVATSRKEPLGKSMKVLRPMTKISRISQLSSTSENVKVVIRVRPLVATEVKDSGTTFALAIKDGCSITAKMKDAEEKNFIFDHVFEPSVKQRVFFESIMRAPLEKFVSGINACIFCCKATMFTSLILIFITDGQTGSGKTWTMLGSADSDESLGITVTCVRACVSMCVHARVNA